MGSEDGDEWVFRGALMGVEYLVDDSAFSTGLILLGLLLLSAYFSASETAFTGLNRSRLKAMSNMGENKASRTLSLLDDYDRLLSTTLIGNNIVNIVAASLATVLFTRIFPHNGVLISTIIMSALVLIFGEITPKSLAKEAPLRFAIATSPLIRFFIFILRPVSFFFVLWRKVISRVISINDHESPTEEELLTIVDEAEADGDIDPLEGKLIRSAIEFNDLDVEDILTPRVNVVAVPKDATMAEVEQVFVANSFSRLPVYHNSIDSIIGVIHEKDFLAEMHYGRSEIKPIVKKALYASPSMKISTLLRSLQREKLHLAVVIDEFGGTEGIVTLEDILEELVGEIWDEHDEVIEPIVQTGAGAYCASGDANMEDVFEELGIDTLHMDYNAITLGGWMIEQLDKIPQTGETFRYEQIVFTVLEADEKMVKQVGIKTLDLTESAEAE
ncbi:MAG: hemolysin family protein [Firmicutes bacterium]|nr:hemolysin family protein [Bacillota bacterium]